MSDNLVCTNEDTREKILQIYNRTCETIKEDVKVLKMWLEKQLHLPEVLDDRKIEKFLILNKFSIEKTKAKIDMYYTIRSLIPELYQNSNPKLENMKKITDVVYYINLPKLTDDLYNILIFKLNDFNADNFIVYDCFSHAFNIAEIRLNEENHVLGDIIIYDLIGIKIGHLSKLTPTALMKISTVVEKVYSNRIKQIHFINCPTFIDTLIKLIKSVLKPKLAERIYIHKNNEDLYKYIPRKILPRDYGGEEKSLFVLNELLKEKFVEYQERFDKLDEMKVNESLRPEKLVNDDVLGFYGNFKQLNVD